MKNNFISLCLCFSLFSVCFLCSCGNSNLKQAVEYQADGEYVKALVFYKKSIEAGKDVALCEKNSGDIFFTKGDFQKAFNCYKRSIEKDPNLALDQIIKFISYNDKDVRSIAIEMLFKVKNPAAKEKIMATIATMLKSQKQHEKIDALEVVAKFGTLCEPILNNILVLLDDQNPIIQQKTLSVLPPMASLVVQAGALEKIKAFLKQDNELVKVNAIECLGDMGRYSMEALPQLIELTDQQEMFKGPAYTAIRKIGLPSRDQAAQLVSYLNADKSFAVRSLVLSIFSQMGPEANDFMPDILLLLKDKDHKIAQIARETLMKIGGASEKSVPALIKLLNEQNTEIRLRAISELAAIGPKANSAVEPLKKLLQDSNKEVRKYSENALQKIQQK
ncbi:MAG: HEAT repeat domain-containing protein [Endomicrobiaceae bacterium]|nr:HEAT repeat domain-containing protein [Endomicrobiaceae bacterium]